jgi:hypothetical protein
MVEYPHGQIRAVTPHGITAADVDRVVDAAAEALLETARLRSGDTVAPAT